jgi:FkbM family methyltransferase
MLSDARTYAWEFIRCTRHNLLHLRRFRLSYAGGGIWHVRDGDVEMAFPYYPYIPFYDIEGYLNGGRWLPEPGMTVLDAGGCNGEFALYAAKRVGPTGRVLMLEPDPKNVAVARRVFEMNGNPANIEIVPVGLWSKPDKLRFSAGHDAQSTIAAGAAVADDPNMIEIEVHSLPSLTRQLGLERLDLVKMDIEGAELEAISALPDMPQNLRPRFAIASYHVVDGRRAADVLPELFRRAGYVCETGHPQHLTTWASPATAAAAT